VQDYNTTVRQFPTNLTAMVFKMDVKPNFAVENEAAISAPPKVDFNKPAPAPAPAAPGAPKADAKGAPSGDAAADLMKKGY
jgi:LemA protein